MELKELGKTGVMLPEIGLGTAGYTGGVEPLRKGIALGAFHLDTAEIYETEDAVGEAISGMNPSYQEQDVLSRLERDGGPSCGSWAR